MDASVAYRNGRSPMTSRLNTECRSSLVTNENATLDTENVIMPIVRATTSSL